jgi:hypothetical protein
MLKHDFAVTVRGGIPWLKSVGVLCCLLVFVVEALAGNSRYRGGLRNSPGKQRLSAKQMKEVLESLRAKTGWRELSFDEEGFLVCPAPDDFEGGSAAARRLLSEAMASQQAYDLEAHNLTSEVVFARLAVPIAYESRRTGERIDAYPVQIDFADFNRLSGDREALRAFDVGLVILHELAHGVWALRDAQASAEELGECETYINSIRRELALPERQTYQAKVRSRLQQSTGGTTYFAELLFARTVEKNGKPKQERFFLQWEAGAAGRLPALLNERWPTITATAR